MVFGLVSLAPAIISAAHTLQVIIGQVLTAGVGQNPARQSALKAGLPETWLKPHHETQVDNITANYCLG